MSKDRTPPEIAAVRRRRQRGRLWIGTGLCAGWLALLWTGTVIGSAAMVWAGSVLLLAEVVVLTDLHEKVLRKIAGRPAADYSRIRKLDKAAIRNRQRSGTP